MKKHLRPGRVYRTEELAQWSSSDRHLKELIEDGTLQKLRNGLYYCPRKFAFGEAPAEERELVRAFLKTDHFVVTSPNAYNQLGLGTTQLYDKRVVYNQKRHGTFPLGGRLMSFKRRLNVPRQLSPEFLLVDVVNELDQLAEDVANLPEARGDEPRRVGDHSAISRRSDQTVERVRRGPPFASLGRGS